MGDFVNSLTIAHNEKQRHRNFQRTKKLFMGTKFYKDAKIPPPIFYCSQFPYNIAFSDTFSCISSFIKVRFYEIAL